MPDTIALRDAITEIDRLDVLDTHTDPASVDIAYTDRNVDAWPPVNDHLVTIMEHHGWTPDGSVARMTTNHHPYRRVFLREHPKGSDE